MRGSAAFRAAVAPGGALAGPWVRDPLWNAAKAVPSLDLRFADNKSLVDATTGQNLVTFTRASSGTFVGSDGVLRTATNDAPRFDHNPTTGESLGLLVEEQRTNLLLRSEEFDNASWFKSAVTVTGNATQSPSALVDADKLVDTTATSSHFTNQTVSITATSRTASIYLKAGERTLARIEHNGNTGNAGRRIAINLSTGIITSAVTIGSGGLNSFSESISAVGNGWYRITSIIDPTTTTGNTGVLTIQILDSSGQASYTGDGSSGLFVWGAQLEAGAFPTSYIPTTTAAATRSADVATDTTRGAALRSLFAQFRSPASGTRPIVSLDDNTANERIELFTSGTDPKLLVTDGGSAQADIDAGAITANTTARLAARFSTDNFAASVSGGAEVLDATGTMPTMDRIRIGRDQAGNYLNGTIARITGWDAPLNVLPQVTQ